MLTADSDVYPPRPREELLDPQLQASHQGNNPPLRQRCVPLTFSEPEHLSLTPTFRTARTSGLQLYVPKDYYRHLVGSRSCSQRLESARSGEDLGADFPYNFLGKDRVWRSRKYNVRVNPVPIDVSRVKCVDFYKRCLARIFRLQVWSAHWYEDGVRRMRWFRCAYGFNRAKRAAEEFRKTLIMAGRVYDMKTESQKRLESEKLKSLRLLRSKRFSFVVKRRL